MIGFDGQLAWSQDAAGLKVTMPAQKPCQHAYVLKLRLDKR